MDDDREIAPVVNYHASGTGRECWTADAAWWECRDPRCPCEGIVVRHGEVPCTEERARMEYVRRWSPHPLP